MNIHISKASICLTSSFLIVPYSVTLHILALYIYIYIYCRGAIAPQVAVCSIIYPRRNHDINSKFYDFSLFMKMESLLDCPPCTPINFQEFLGLYITVIGGAFAPQVQ